MYRIKEIAPIPPEIVEKGENIGSQKAAAPCTVEWIIRKQLANI